MSKKRWTLTSFKNGKPVATEHDLDHQDALAAVRAAMAGEDSHTRDAAPEPLSPAELGAAAFLARAA